MPVFDFSVVVPYWTVFVAGVQITFGLTAVALVIGIGLGLILALAKSSGIRAIAWPTYAYIEFFRTTPPLVQIIWFYFGMPVLTGIDFTAFEAAAIALGLNMAAFFAEIFRAGLQGIDRTQWHAAQVLGLSRADALRFVVLPQAIRIVLPPTGTTVILLIKGTSLASAIGVSELMRVGQLISLETFRPLESLTVVAIMYFVITYPVALLFRAAEKRLRVGED